MCHPLFLKKRIIAILPPSYQKMVASHEVCFGQQLIQIKARTRGRQRESCTTKRIKPTQAEEILLLDDWRNRIFVVRKF